ncbi:hypothetical protein GOP47_0027072 [Adiantum capillus-veneris]|nr:hypothetical protein GOP47_0027072 [Adiantum capillus-veneris]
MAKPEASQLLLWASLALVSFQAFCFWSVVASEDKQLILQPSLVDKVNNHPQSKWKADMNLCFANTTVEEFKKLLGAFMDDEQEKKSMHTHPRTLKLPLSFDARDAWPQCVSLQSILGQGHCGSCWAFGAAEALSDRFCIHYNESVVLSENDLLSCCGFECGGGCNGGYPLRAWEYFVRSGVVTSECVPYFDTEGCQHPGCEPLYPTPECVQECSDNTDWQTAKYYASSAYRVGSDPYDIMAEIYTNGPVEVSFQVYADFALYKSGVYHYVSGDYLGGHAVKMIGWGTTEEGVDYWVLANSWNQQWGQDGYFLMQRGMNACGIESNVVAGMPASRSLLADQ